jgi:hypothetical protein
MTTVNETCLLGYDIMLCSPLKVNQSVRGMSLHLQDQRIRQARNQHENRWKDLFLKPETEGDMFLQNVLTTTVRTSNPTQWQQYFHFQIQHNKYILTEVFESVPVFITLYN